MIFEPETDWYGLTKFKWKAYDGKSYSGNEADVEIKIISVNDPPVITNFSLTGNKGETVWFSKYYFVSNFKDVDSDELTKIKIIKVPNKGTLKL